MHFYLSALLVFLFLSAILGARDESERLDLKATLNDMVEEIRSDQNLRVIGLESYCEMAASAADKLYGAIEFPFEKPETFEMLMAAFEGLRDLVFVCKTLPASSIPVRAINQSFFHVSSELTTLYWKSCQKSEKNLTILRHDLYYLSRMVWCLRVLFQKYVDEIDDGRESARREKFNAAFRENHNIMQLPKIVQHLVDSKERLVSVPDISNWAMIEDDNTAEILIVSGLIDSYQVLKKAFTREFSPVDSDDYKEYFGDLDKVMGAKETLPLLLLFAHETNFYLLENLISMKNEGNILIKDTLEAAQSFEKTIFWILANRSETYDARYELPFGEDEYYWPGDFCGADEYDEPENELIVEPSCIIEPEDSHLSVVDSAVAESHEYHEMPHENYEMNSSESEHLNYKRVDSLHQKVENLESRTESLSDQFSSISVEVAQKKEEVEATIEKMENIAKISGEAMLNLENKLTESATKESIRMHRLSQYGCSDPRNFTDKFMHDHECYICVLIIFGTLAIIFFTRDRNSKTEEFDADNILHSLEIGDPVDMDSDSSFDSDAELEYFNN